MAMSQKVFDNFAGDARGTVSSQHLRTSLKLLGESTAVNLS